MCLCIHTHMHAHHECKAGLTSAYMYVIYHKGEEIIISENTVHFYKI